MRIVYFYQYFGTTQGGWSTRVYEMCKRWVEDGHQVTVITSPYDKSDVEAFKGLTKKVNVEGIDVIVLNVPQSNKHSTLKRILRFVQYITLATYYALKLKYDVAIASSGPITVGYLGIVAKVLRRKKFVFEVRDLWPDGSVQLGVLKNKLLIKMAFWFEHLCYKKADLIVVCSAGMKKDIEDRFHFNNIIVIPNACDTIFFSLARQKPIATDLQNKKLVVYAGSLGVMDHCMQIMEAAALLDTSKYPDVAFLIIGDGVERKMMQEYKEKHQLHHVHFYGLIPKTEVAPLLCNATCSIVCFKNVPVLNTVSPNKMFDAFAAGVPIIQTTQGWIKEMLAESGAGITVYPDNPAQMLGAILNYIDDEALRERDASNAYQLATTVFSRDKCAQDMLQAILAIANPSEISGEYNIHPTVLVDSPKHCKKHKVTFVVDWYTPSSHATSLRMRPWVDELRKHGQFDVSILTDEVSKGQQGVSTNIFHSPDNRTRLSKRLIQELLLGTELFLKIIFSSKRTVIISSPPFIVACFSSLACFISRKPYIFDVRDLYPLVYANSGFIKKESLVFRLLYRIAQKCYRNALFTSTVTPQLVEYIQSAGQVNNVKLIKNGFNGKLFVPSNEKFEDFTLVFHGNIGQFQNPMLLVQVVEELNRRNEKFRCIAIGSGSRQKVFENHPVKNLEYLGRLNNEDLAAIIQKAHVGISFRTKDEISARSIPVRVSEYIGIGIPTVLTPKSEGGDLLDAYQVGKSFNNEELQEICDFIVSLKYNGDLYAYYKNNALRIRANFSRETGAMLFVKNMQDFLKLPESAAETV